MWLDTPTGAAPHTESRRRELCVDARRPWSSPVCVCVSRIGELREVMDDILHTQCDYDPASGESYDFDRFVSCGALNCPVVPVQLVMMSLWLGTRSPGSDEEEEDETKSRFCCALMPARDLFMCLDSLSFRKQKTISKKKPNKNCVLHPQRPKGTTSNFSRGNAFTLFFP